MSTPASELADLMQAWGFRNKSPIAHRAEQAKLEPDSLAFWREQGRLAQLLQEVEQMSTKLKAAGKSTRAIDYYMDEYYHAVFSSRHPWMTDQSSAQLIRHEAVLALWDFSELWEATFRDRVVDDQMKADLRELLTEARGLIAEYEDVLSGAELEYVYTLVAAAFDAVDQTEVLGGFDLRAHLERLNGALVNVAAQVADVDPEGGRRFVEFAFRVVAVARKTMHDGAALAAISGWSLAAISGQLPPA
jgi:hypothetical protein